MPTAEAPPSARAPRREPLVREDYELDLRAFFGVIGRHWRFVLGSVLIAMAAAALVVLAQPTRYVAVAQVFIQRPKLQFAYEPRLPTSTDFEVRPFYTHAKHPDVEAAVQQKLGSALTTLEQSPGALNSRLRVGSHRDDQALMELIFSDPDPRRASTIANLWADAFVEHARSALNPAAQAQKMVEAELKTLRSELDAREDGVRQFSQGAGIGLPLREESTRVEVTSIAAQPGTTTPAGTSIGSVGPSVVYRLGSRGRALEARAGTLASFRASRDQLRLVTAQARALRTAGLGLAALAPELTSLGSAAGRNAVPIDAASLANADAIIAGLEARERALGEAIDALSAEVRALESSLAADVAQLERLERDRDIAREAYLTLAKKGEENRIALSSEWPVVRVFSRAPEVAGAEPAPWPLALSVAAAVGLLVGTIGAFVLDSPRSRGSLGTRRLGAAADSPA